MSTTTVSANDAAGGSGSLTQSLLGILVNGISRTVDGSLAKRYPLTSFNELQTINADGTPRSYGAPQKAPSATQSFGALVSNPYVIAGGAAVVVTLLILLAVRR